MIVKDELVLEFRNVFIFWGMSEQLLVAADFPRSVLFHILGFSFVVCLFLCCFVSFIIISLFSLSSVILYFISFVVVYITTFAFAKTQHVMISARNLESCLQSLSLCLVVGVTRTELCRHRSDDRLQRALAANTEISPGRKLFSSDCSPRVRLGFN